MNKSELKNKVEQTGSYFFAGRTLRFFGDTMSNYVLSNKPVTINTYSENKVKCWELRRKKPVKYGLDTPAYFDVKTFERQIPKH